MIHEKLVIPVRTNHNKLNSSVPFKVQVSGTTKPNVFYDLSTGYLKFKVRLNDVSYKVANGAFDNNNQPTSNPVTVAEIFGKTTVTPYDVLYVPTMTPHFCDYVKGYINCVEGDEEIQYSFSDINYEDMCQHTTMLNFLNTHPCQFDCMRHIYTTYNGANGFGGKQLFNSLPLNNRGFRTSRRFDNKVEFKLESINNDKTKANYIATITVPLSAVLEPASRASLINLKLLDLDFFMLDLGKYIDVDMLYNGLTGGEKTNNISWYGDSFVTTNSDFMYYNDSVAHNTKSLCEFNFKDLEIYDCDLYIDQFEFSDMTEFNNMPNTQKGLVCAQVDNHVMDIDPTVSINKFNIRVPFKPSTCYIYFTHDSESDCSNRTDYLYLNPPKYLNVKTLTGWSNSYPYYENGPTTIADPKDVALSGSVDHEYRTPDPRLFEELHYVVNKYDTPLLNYDSFRNVHRIYAVDMNSHLNLSDNTNELIMEVEFEHPVDNDLNVRAHVIFERDYSK